MFDTLEIHYRDQGSGFPPWEDGGREPHWNMGGFNGGLNPDAPPTQDDVVRPDDEELPEEDDSVVQHRENGSPFVDPNELVDRAGSEAIFGNPEDSPTDLPIEDRASEAEKIYANLLMKTDFDREFIEEVLEFEPDEESELRIDELRRKREEMEDLFSTMPPQGPQPPQGPGIDMIMV